MATTILPFVVRRRPHNVTRPPAGEAKIIIFPGVRYEPGRVDEGAEKQKQRDGRARKRKTKAQ